MAEKDHKHDWYVGGYVVPGDNEQLRKVEVARHPANGMPFDLDNPKHRVFMDELGIVTTAPPPREHKVIFDCACGETRHVPMTKDGIAKANAALHDPDKDPGRIPAHELVEAMPK